MPAVRSTLLALGLALGAAAAAQDEAAPALDFLEYLGSWEEGDEEWLVVAEDLVAEEFMGQVSGDAGDTVPAVGEPAPAADADEDETEQTDED